MERVASSIRWRPTIGEIGTQETVEVKMKLFSKNIETILVSEMKKTHPYESFIPDIHVRKYLQDVGSGIVGELENEISTLDF